MTMITESYTTNYRTKDTKISNRKALYDSRQTVMHNMYHEN